METKVTKEQAIIEVDSWLAYKKVSESKRDSQKDSVEALVEAVSAGLLILNPETKEFTHVLKFPTEGDKPCTELVYKPRLAVASTHTHLQGVKASDADGRVLAYVAALTSKPKALIKALDTEDYSVAQSVAVFFL